MRSLQVTPKRVHAQWLREVYPSAGISLRNSTGHDDLAVGGQCWHMPGARLIWITHKWR